MIAFVKTWWVWILVGVFIVGAVFYVGQAALTTHANEAAIKKVPVAVAAAKAPEVAAANKANTKAGEKNANRVARVRAAAARIPVASDSDDMFYIVVCDEELYKGDPECSGRRSLGGEGRGPK